MLPASRHPLFMGSIPPKECPFQSFSSKMTQLQSSHPKPLIRLLSTNPKKVLGSSSERPHTLKYHCPIRANRAIEWLPHTITMLQTGRGTLRLVQRLRQPARRRYADSTHPPGKESGHSASAGHHGSGHHSHGHSENVNEHFGVCPLSPFPMPS